MDWYCFWKASQIISATDAGDVDVVQTKLFTNVHALEDKLHFGVWVTMITASAILSFSLFDILGDAVGGLNAFWIVIVMSSCPWIILIMKRSFAYYFHRHDTRDEEFAETSDEIEMSNLYPSNKDEDTKANNEIIVTDNPLVTRA
jgi:hypothetical protein